MINKSQRNTYSNKRFCVIESQTCRYRAKPNSSNMSKYRVKGIKSQIFKFKELEEDVNSRMWDLSECFKPIRARQMVELDFSE